MEVYKKGKYTDLESFDSETSLFENSKNQNILTLIVPCYNSEEYIGRAIESVLSQTLKDIEIIVYDDASTDNSVSILLSYCKKHKNIKLLLAKDNEGQGRRRNQAIKLAKSKYIAFLDADDYFDNIYYFEECIAEIEKENADVLITSFSRERKSKKNKNSLQDNSYTGFDAAQRYLSREFLTHAAWSKVYKREVIEKVCFSEYGYSQDVTFVFNALANAKKVIVRNIYGYIYYNDNISSWRPRELTIYHIYSSFRLILEVFYDILSCYSKYKVKIRIDKFLETYRQDHGKRLRKFLEENESLFEDVVILFKTYISVVMYAIDDPIINGIIEKILFTKFNQIQNISKNFCNYISLLDSKITYMISEGLQSDKKDKSILVYTNNLFDGGLERIAQQAGEVLSEEYKTTYLLDEPEEINFATKNTIIKADIFDPEVISLLENSRLILDYKYKNIEDSFPLVKYMVDFYSYKYVATVHNTYTCQHYTYKLFQYTNGNLNCLRKIVAVSNVVKNSILESYPDLQNIALLYNPVDIEGIKKSKKIETTERFILFAARLNATEHKGIDVLIDAYNAMQYKDECKLYLCGSWDLEKYIKEKISDLHLEDNIKVLGFKKDIWSYMKSCQFLIVTSRWEGFCLSIIESLACGAPVLTTKVGIAEEIIEEKRNGMFIDIDKVEEIAEKMDYMYKNRNSFLISKSDYERFCISNFKQEIYRVLD